MDFLVHVFCGTWVRISLGWWFSECGPSTRSPGNLIETQNLDSLSRPPESEMLGEGSSNLWVLFVKFYF